MAIGWSLIRAEINSKLQIDDFFNSTMGANTSVRMQTFEEQQMRLAMGNAPKSQTAFVSSPTKQTPGASAYNPIVSQNCLTKSKVAPPKPKRKSLKDIRKSLYSQEKESDEDEEMSQSPAPQSNGFSMPGGSMFPFTPLMAPRPIRSFDGLPASDANHFLRAYERMTTGMSAEMKKNGFSQHLEGPAADWFDVIETRLKAEND